MFLEEQIRRLEQEIGRMEQVTHLTERLLAEVMKSAAPPTDLEKVRGFLRSAHDLLKHGEQDTAQQLVDQARQALESVRHWLAVADLGISPFLLRTFLEREPPGRDRQRSLIRYFLTKSPHAENDRDKLDYLLTAFFSSGPAEEVQARLARTKELHRAVEELFEGVSPPELPLAAEMMMHEMESLIARVEDFTEFDQLVHARMVERVRALKINLGESFYHPQVLPTVIRFNVAFRQHFDKLLRQQLAAVRQETRQRLEEAWQLVRAIEAASESLALPEAQRVGGGLEVELGEEAVEPRLGRPLEVLDERPPIDRLVRRGAEPQKESELRGILNRMARFLARLPAEQARADKVVFPLRHAELELSDWEREAFAPPAAETAPQGARTIQYALGVMAWIEEELTRYQQVRAERYLWKTHFDHLSYAVVRALDLLKAIRELIRPGAPEAEAAWFGPLLQTALRLGNTLNRVRPVFEEPAA